jgi:GETHR pentapeptide repeat (5 copies)
MLQMRRSRGAASGFLLVLLGLWGALIPFIGPYFHYAYTPATAWTYNTGRLWLEILPGAAVFLGGVLLMIATARHTALFGALLAAAAGAWFSLGTMLSPLWNNHVTLGGSPASTTVYMRIMEQLGFFSALGVVIVFIAAVAFGRVASVASGIRPIETVPPETVPPETVPVETARGETVRGETVRDETAPVETVRHETVRDETVRDETVGDETEALPRRRTRADETVS